MNSKEPQFSRKRKPIIALICEGRNKTEIKYFNHFIKRENPYTLKLIPSESTDPTNMIKKAKEIINNFQLEDALGDKAYCLIDLDLSQSQYQMIQKEKSKKSNLKCEIQFILSNPCFEIWLLYYFTNSPKKESSSKKVKEQLKKYVPEYKESYDIVREYKLHDKWSIAINNSELKNQLYSDDINILDKNPYSEVQNIVSTLVNFFDKKIK